MRIIYLLILLLHGTIHFMGFIKAFRLATIAQFTRDISKPMGLFWLLTGLLFIVTAILYILKKDAWSILAILAVLLSQILILFFWQDAKYGTVANIVIVVVAILAFAAASFEKSYQNDVVSAMDTTEFKKETIKEKDLNHLPTPVQKYLHYVGVLGKPKVKNFKISFEGEMRGKDQDWFNFSSEQYNFTASPTRLFFMKAKVKGLPSFGYHRYKDRNASMRIKLLSIFPVVNLDRQELYPTETVTFFNDLCMFAPAGLIDERIAWETIDDNTAKAIFTTNGTTISAILYFNEEGQLVNFVSKDRISVAEMKTFPFSTPVKDYKNVNGYNLPTFGQAIWHYPDEKFVYGKFRLIDVKYNVSL